MAELVPIKFVVGLHEVNGQMQHKHPNFNKVPAVKRGFMDWSNYFTKVSGGQHYDKKCGHFDVDDESPNYGEWLGAVLVEEEFALAAIDVLPDVVSIMTEEEWERFYDERAHAHEPTEYLDTEELQGILARKQLEDDPEIPTVLPSSEILSKRSKCLDPEDMDHRGIRKNTNKTWKLKKAKTGITIKNIQR